MNYGEYYHCSLDATIEAWAKDQGEKDYCLWSYGEMAPPANSEEPSAYTVTE